MAPAVETCGDVARVTLDFGGADVVNVLGAPQGGYGVPFDVRVEGARVDEPLSVELRTLLDGEDVGFWRLEATVECEASEAWLRTLVAGLDPGVYTDSSAVQVLDGEVVELYVDIVDAAGSELSGMATITLSTMDL